MKSNSQQVKVFLRCRPPLKRELSSGQYRSVVSCNVERPNSVNIRVERDGQTFIKTFDFDGVFNQTANQLDVYKRVAVHSIEEMLKGYDCTIFAYGQTGTGKTYTMEGRPSRETKWDVNSDAGLIPRVCQHLFEELENIDSEYSVQISYVELYNEKLRDLLSPHYSELKLLNDSKGNVIIEGVEEVVVHSNENVYDCLDGCWKRKTASTKMNENSSRSHTVFTITTHVKSRNSGEEDILITGKLHLVDLAGSENIGRSGATNMRAQEAGKINKSLLTLGRVITALVEKTGRVPYRDSLLTRILQNSLGGKAKTNIIATISPAHINLEETLSTCIYASRAKFIENQPEVNQTLTKKALIKEYTMIIERLRKDLYTTRSKNGIYLSEERYEEIMGQLAQKDHESSTLSISVSSLQEKCDELTNANSSLRTELRETLKELKQGNKRNEELSEKLLASQKELNVSNIKINEKEYIITVQEETERKLREETKALRNIMDLLKNDQQIVYSACEELANHHRKQIAVIRRVEDCLYRNASSLLL
ncbi:kinesin-like protein KLP2 [Zophobas morio]|uniref:kinesin-like protein KLP2 n=1 Tax=Zophobas morio TaxID=2755281 RepID=UPI00308395E5